MAIKVRTGNQWVPVSGGGGESIGVIMAWGGPSGNIPNGYLLCDGSAISRTTYSDLFSVLNNTHGSGDGSNTFNIPDLRDKFIVGASSGSGDTTWPGLSPGATGGSADNSLPSHYHNFPGDDQLSGANGLAGWSNTHDGNYSYDANSTTSGGGKMWRTSTVGTTGTNENLPPYYALCYVIKVFNTRATVTGGVGGSLTVENNGSQLTTSASVINFSTGLTASGSGGNITVTGGAVSSFNSTKIVTFTGNNTYTPTSGTKSITVYCIAGGGGSSYVEGGTDSEGGNFYDRSGGGGGGGACVGYYNLTGSFSATVTIGPGGTGGTNAGSESGGSGGESKFTPTGGSSYSGDGELDAEGGGGVNQDGVGGAGGGTASGGTIQLHGDRGEYRGSFYPGKGGRAGYVFGHYGKGGMGSGPTSNSQNGNAGGAGIVVIYEYIN